jgi:parallel beta-helix repeat protein
MKFGLLGLVVAAVVGVASLGHAQAATASYYVSTKGSDNYAGTSSRPWRTIAKATASAPAGSNIFVLGGTYDPFTVTKSGQTVTAYAASQPVYIKGKSGVQDVVRINASGVTLSNMTVYGCVPNSNPSGGFEDNGSSGVRINDGANNVSVKGMTIRDGKGTNSYGLAFGCYGILVHKADGSIISGNTITGNGQGIFMNGGGSGAQITNNVIRDNNVIIRNTPGNNDDFGGGGVSFDHLTALPGPTASGNTLTNNIGKSSDYGTDGGAFEIYNASNVTMTGNTIGNNENVLETGTFPGGDCKNNTFSNNTVSGKSAGSTLDWSKGMILRCATGMVINANNFTEVDWWVFDIEAGDQFSSGVKGLTITNNQISQWQKVYHLGVDPIANNLVVDNNKLHFTGPIFASYADGTTSPSLADWQLRSGLDLNSTTY